MQASSFLSSVISCARQTTADHIQYVRLDKLDISNSEMECKPAILVIRWSNSSHSSQIWTQSKSSNCPPPTATSPSHPHPSSPTLLNQTWLLSDLLSLIKVLLRSSRFSSFGEEIKKLISSVMSGIFRMLRLSLLSPEIRKTRTMSST